MKTFRRSFWKTCTFKFGLLPGYVFLLLLGGYYLHDMQVPVMDLFDRYLYCWIWRDYYSMFLPYLDG